MTNYPEPAGQDDTQTALAVADPTLLNDQDRGGCADLIRGVLNEEKTSRRSEVRKAWQQRAFRNGIQHIWYDPTSYAYMMPEASGQELPRFMDVYNIYTPHWRSFVSILSQNPPGINFVPNDLQKGVDVTAATYAEKMRHVVDRLVHMKDRQSEASGLFCTDGRTITRTYIDSKGKLRVSVHGVLESKVPIFARKMEKWGYCVLSEEGDLYEAKDEWEEFADEIDSTETGGTDSQFERYARLNIISNRKGGIGDLSKNLTTTHTCWLRPSRYRKATDELKAKLKSLFPDGVRLTMVGGVVVDAVPEQMEEALTVEWPSPGQGQNRPSMLNDLVPIQESFNDAMNMIREHGEYSIPARWIADSVDSEAIAEQISAPGITHQITVPHDSSIADLVFIEPALQLPPELVANVDRLLSFAEFTSGDLPSLSGEGDPHSETASGQKMLSDQAKGQLSNAWAGIQWLFAGTYEKAVRFAATMTDQPTIAIQGGSGQDSFSPSAILDGNFGCYPDTDSSFPETMADKRASLQMVLTQIASAGDSGLAIATAPDNLKLVKQYSGLADLVIPGAEARDKQLREIEQMLQEPPIPDESQMPQYIQAAQQAQAQGQPLPPPPMKSSIPIDPVWDYHQPEADKVQEWLSSTSRAEEERKGNLQGIENIKLHGQAHKDAIQAQAPAPQFKPPNVSVTAAVTDPVAIASILARDGIQTTPQNIEASQVPDQQEQMANTQHKAAQAQHISVLAAKEAVEPAGGFADKNPSPDQLNQGEKNG